MCYNYEKERIEAIDAGKYALSNLSAAKNELDTARGWGIIDILGGGFLSTAIKQSKMNSARRYIEHARQDLARFSKELNDLAGHITINVDLDSFASFADYFFDGMISDFYVQSKINQARDQIDQAISMVSSILNKLEYQN